MIFYAGMPLKSSQGFNIGTLCVIDHEKKELSEEQKKALRVLSQQVITQLELKKSNVSLAHTLKENQRQSFQLQEEREHRHNEQKWVSLGKMAGSIAHEVSTPLGTISLANSKIMRSLNNDSPKETLIGTCQMIDKTVDRIGHILGGLKAISNNGMTKQKEDELLHDLITTVLDQCRQQFKEHNVHIQLEGDFEQLIPCHPTELKQIVFNLVNNALQATLSHEKPWIKITHSMMDATHIISITDSGLGIKEHSQIMDPFYTTRPHREGRGMGLSISRGLAEAHGGKLTYDSGSSNTKFDISLPVKA